VKEKRPPTFGLGGFGVDRLVVWILWIVDNLLKAKCCLPIKSSSTTTTCLRLRGLTDMTNAGAQHELQEYAMLKDYALGPRHY
jgi:hypothetical protein